MKILYGVGVGPGDPELLTLKAVRLIQEAQWIFAPRTKRDETGRAERVVQQYLSGRQVAYLHFPMGAENAENYIQAAKTIHRTLKNGESGVFLTLGDPLVYSTYVYLMREVRKFGIEQRVIPGITSFHAAGSAVSMPICIKNDTFYLSDGALDENILARVQTVCILKPREKDKILEQLEQHGFHYQCVKNCSLPGQEVLTEKERILRDHAYMSLILARKD